MSHCSNCHRDAPEGARFCAHCGSVVVRPGSSEPADSLIGRTLKGTYLVQEVVGGGGMGKVYRATHLTLDVPVALKVLKRELLDNPSLVQRFHREARAATRLRHPNVIAVTDFGQTEDGTLFMAMEFVAGRGLGRIIAEESPLSEARVIRIGAQILAALAEAHAAGVLHRDLKPGNVMIEARRDEPDFVKVIDFGIAKIQAPEEGRGTLTQAGLVWGTPCYMSPEQWNEEELDARTDLYSVGVILYEMLAGQKPYEADTPMAMLKRLLAERPVPPRQRRAGITVSPALEALVLRALAFHRADRPASADEMRAALLACLPRVAPQLALSEAKGATLPETAEQRIPETAALPSRVAEAPQVPERPTQATAAPPPGKPEAAGATEPEKAAPAPRPVRSRRSAPPSAGLGPRRLAAAVAVAALLAGAGIWLARKPTTAAVQRPVASRESADAAVAFPAATLAPAVGPSSDAGRGAPEVETAPAARADSGDAGPADAGSEAGEGHSAAASREPLAGAGGPAAAAPPPVESKASVHGGSGESAAAAAAAESRGERKGALAGEGARDARVQPALKEVARRHGVVLVRDVVRGVPTPPASSGDGVLSIQAEPCGDVFLDGQAYGEAPREFRVAAGTYAVRVTNQKFGRKEMRIEVRAGKRVQWTAEFVQGR
jgi:serine/threonine protein kinase